MAFEFNFLAEGEMQAGKVSLNDSKNETIFSDFIAKAKEVERPLMITQDLTFRNITLVDELSLIVAVPEEQSNKINTIGIAEYDIIPGKYEGGLKIWECSLDLARHLLKHPLVQRPVAVIELGCGHGIPGICALMMGCSDLYFSDFNVDVLSLTWANVIKNVHAETQINSVRCFAGDWFSLSQHLMQSTTLRKEFDLILSAETLYNENVCKKLFRMLDLHLSRNGIAYFASKKYYFGVGGGTDFLKHLVQQSTGFQASTESLFDDGVSNIREILLIKRKAESAG